MYLNLIFEKENAPQAKTSIGETKSLRRPAKNYAKEIKKFDMQKTTNEMIYLRCLYSLKQQQLLTKRHSSGVLNCQSDLVPIKLNDMQLNTIHHGKYLQCRTLADPFYCSSMFVLIADGDNQVETVYIYNYFASLGYQNHDPSQLLPSGTHMVIKEPYLKLMGDGQYNIRVDSPNDIVILPQLVDPNNNNTNNAISILETVESLIAKGNQYFVKGSYHLAIWKITVFSPNLKSQIKNFKNPF